MDSIYWLVALIILLLIEIFTLGLASIWFAGGAVISFIISLFSDNIILEILAFIVVSFVLLYFTRPIAVKYFNGKRVKTNYESLEGSTGKVLETIDNFNGTGVVQVNGLEWTARAYEDSAVIKEGKKVLIKKVSGVKLIVEEESEGV
ncbi:NfeD family protein [Anaerocolumna xylanovorans]|uniref:Membrane protein implicated in regulation of membrane protease activity n=1 Tax=Anaerocolumna xylanovorans DSM 12503 TaxID=1121345 RepID=A0A1M7YN39_9FIRM|nr:NfeD family protein [Anaerocolumna xylanovorans]SHO54081.1 Membrane protein implicated in regulation of membrane protease activity [Anaerocolumna xylanovorans DSM 12503]